MLRCSYRRNTAIITCLMAEALDIQSLHVPVKVCFINFSNLVVLRADGSLIYFQCPQSRYGLITPMAKTLHEDPSCQLCNILRKYLLLNSNVEHYLKDDVPHLSILRQVIILIFSSGQMKMLLVPP